MAFDKMKKPGDKYILEITTPDCEDDEVYRYDGISEEDARSAISVANIMHPDWTEIKVRRN